MSATNGTRRGAVTVTGRPGQAPKPNANGERKWGLHLEGVAVIPGVGDVEWERTKKARVLLKEAVTDLGLVVIVGPPGVGKTFSVARAAETCAKSVDQVVWLEIPTEVRGRALLANLYPPLAGGPAARGATEGQLHAGLEATLSGARRLVVVDEAQFITSQALLTLRSLHAAADTKFALVVVGTHKLLTNLSPELRSRVTGYADFDRLTDTEAPKVLARFHPRYAEADPAVLAEGNRRYAGGEFRWWTKALVLLNRYVDRNQPLTMQVLTDVAKHFL